MSKIETSLKKKVSLALKKLNFELAFELVTIETPKDESLGDYSSNVALKYAKDLKMRPLDLAQKLVDILLEDQDFQLVTIAGPGFINFVLKPKLYHRYIREIIKDGSNYGNGPDNKVKVNLEFVSANPTGRLHLGHARGAALGDSLARLLSKAGYRVTKEFYVNDAGKQVENLAMSLYARYLQSFNIKAILPEDGYHGQDIVEIANELRAEIGDRFLDSEKEKEALVFFEEEGKKRELVRIKNDLHEFRVDFDVYSFESEIRKHYDLKELIKRLGDNTYIEEGARFLRTSQYLDDKDRPIVKSDGSYTYLLPDIAYHLDKLSRGYTKLIDILGADHHGYIPRITSSLMMFGHPQDILEVEIIQLVRIMQDGQEVKMSKRSGNSLAMHDLIEMVGVDAVRYFFVNRAASTHFDFDINLATSKSSANPVYYAQYAHARLHRVLTLGKNYELDYGGTHLDEPHEISLLKILVSYGKVIEDASRERAPYKITNYIQKLANSIHYFYTKSRIIDPDNPDLTRSRLALAKAAQIVLKDSLELVGVAAPKKM